MLQDALHERLDDCCDPQGLPSLRRLIASSLARGRNLACSGENIVVTCGLRQSFYLIARVLLREGDRVLVEGGLEQELRAVFAGAGTLPVAIDPCDINRERDGAQFANARLAVIAENSSDFRLQERRALLLNWIRDANGWMVEQDTDAGTVRGHIVDSMHRLDPDRVLIAGGFNPSIRSCAQLGYLVVPARLAGAFAGACYMIDGVPMPSTQRAMASFIEGGHLFATHHGQPEMR